MGSYRTGKILVDPKGTSAWLGSNYPDTEYGWKRDPEWRLGECIWAQHGVWDPATDELLRPDYFSKTPTGQVIDAGVFCNTYFMDHWKRWAHGVRSVHQNSLLLLQPPVWVIPPVLDEGTKGLGRIVYAPHYYDGLTLMSKKWYFFLFLQSTRRYLSGGLQFIGIDFSMSMSLVSYGVGIYLQLSQLNSARQLLGTR